MSSRKMVFCALCAALTAALTMFPSLPVPATGGYIHLGDTVILLSCLLLGWPAVASAAVGSALADLCLGAAVYAPVTFVIKGAMAALGCLILAQKQTFWRFVLAALAAEALMAAGYSLFEFCLFGPVAAWAALPANGVQGGAALVLAPLFCLLIQRTGLRKRLGLAAGREPRKESGEKVSAEQEEAGPAAEKPTSDRGGRCEK